MGVKLQGITRFSGYFSAWAAPEIFAEMPVPA
jgi:hypothetical protein